VKRLQRIAAEAEKIILRGDLREAEEIFPDRRDSAFEIVQCCRW
jgi:hypothetical protein